MSPSPRLSPGDSLAPREAVLWGHCSRVTLRQLKTAGGHPASPPRRGTMPWPPPPVPPERVLAERGFPLAQGWGRGTGGGDRYSQPHIWDTGGIRDPNPPAAGMDTSLRGPLHIPMARPSRMLQLAGVVGLGPPQVPSLPVRPDLHQGGCPKPSHGQMQPHHMMLVAGGGGGGAVRRNSPQREQKLGRGAMMQPDLGS